MASANAVVQLISPLPLLISTRQPSDAERCSGLQNLVGSLA